MKVVRKQIYLDEELEAELGKLALLRGKSESAIIREALAEYIARAEQQKRQQHNPLENLLGGLGEGGPDDASERMDYYLYQKDRD